MATIVSMDVWLVPIVLTVSGDFEADPSQRPTVDVPVVTFHQS